MKHLLDPGVRDILLCEAMILCRLLVASVLLLFWFDAPLSAAQRPNLIFILADDMGWSDVGCYGGEISTPNLDQLARQGLRFTQMHNTSKCFPSRACLLTGVYAQQCGMAKSPGKIVNAITLGEALRLAGYRTLAVGKHHGTENLYERGFDHYRGLRDGAANHFNPGRQRPQEGQPAQKRPNRTWCFDGKTVQPFTPPDADFYSTDAYTSWALELLDQHQQEEKPFFLYLTYQAPHDPLQAWPSDIAKYQGVYEVGYQAIREARYNKQRRLGLIDDSFTISAATHAAWEDLSEAKRRDEARRMQVYAAMIDCLDRNVGRLLRWLDDHGRRENTVIFFASDNGASAEVVEIGAGEIGSLTRWASQKKDWANVSNTPFRLYKNASHEGGICTPLIVSWPGVVKPGRIVNDVCHFVDVMPTLLDIAGGSYPQRFGEQALTPLAGASLLPALRGQAGMPPRELYWQWANGKAVYQTPYKLVARGKQWELFDLSQDRTETRNLIEAMPERAAAMKAMHGAWVQRCQAP